MYSSVPRGTPRYGLPSEVIRTPVSLNAASALWNAAVLGKKPFGVCC